MDTKTEKPEENKYDPSLIEKKYQDLWEKEGVFEPFAGSDAAQGKPGKPFYNLMMFPYPSAEGLHVGNLYAFTGSDIFGRFKRMQGFDVFEPIGLDGFGIHSENYALKVGEHPIKVAQKTAANFYRQLRASGNSYAWKHTLETYDPGYYKWTQWIFVKMFKAGLAYKKGAPVNWCPSCKTVLADEQVLPAGRQAASGVCERCNSKVEIKNLKQWFFRITSYAQKLLDNLKKLNWPQKVLLGQKNWIGESKGAEIIFKVEGKDTPIKVFTTRLDTIYGVTAIVIAPDKKGNGDTPLALDLATMDNKENVEQYVKETQNSNVSDAKGRSSTESSDKTQNQNSKFKANETEEEKTGVFTGSFAVNPFSGERIPIWVANYVVGWYGTGALMVVPAHDSRDFEFAKKYKLAVRPVVKITHKAKAFVLQKSVDKQFIDDIRQLKIPVTISASGNFEIGLKPVQIDQFITVVKQNLQKNYWVEIVGCRTVFIFGDGETVEIKSLTDEERVFKKCRLLEKNLPAGLACRQTGRQVSGCAFDLWDMLTEVDWYKDVITASDYGVLINSAEYSGLSSGEAILKMAAFLKDTDSGGEHTQYKLRDWIISRQRYWGAPIPMIFCASCAKNGQGWFPVPEDQLPVLLPEVADWKPKGKGVSPLASVDDFVYTTCPNCKGTAERETDVCDTFLDSSWYYLRYPSVNNENPKSDPACRQAGIRSSKQIQNTETENTKSFEFRNSNFEFPWDREITRRWLPVSQYTGGAEHTVLHLLYSRFVTMALHDMGFLEFDEPFPNLFTHGLIIKDGAKMSKSKGNVVIPDEYIVKYGVDSLRCYLMFLGPWEAGGDFRDSGMHGMFKFLRRIWVLAHDPQKKGEVSSQELKKALHKTIKKVTEDIVKFKYNTALSSMMEFVNAWEIDGQGRTLSIEDMVAFLKLLAPFAPHMTEEIYQNVKCQMSNVKSTDNFDSIHLQSWPAYDETLLVEDKITIVVQVNGKLRAQVAVPRDLVHEREQVIELVLQNETVKKYISDPLKASKIIFVPGRLVNFVV